MAGGFKRKAGRLLGNINYYLLQKRCPICLSSITVNTANNAMLVLASKLRRDKVANSGTTPFSLKNITHRWLVYGVLKNDFSIITNKY